MDFDLNVEEDKNECTTGSGDINDFNVKECRADYPGETLCIFPYYWNGKLYDECALLEEEEFRLPVFLCPVRKVFSFVFSNR